MPSPRINFRYGKRPRDTRSYTVIPSGTSGDCGISPTVQANSFGAISSVFFPSSKISPSKIRFSLQNVFSSVDFPHPFDPRMTETFPIGISTFTSSIITLLSYPVFNARASILCSIGISEFPFLIHRNQQIQHIWRSEQPCNDSHGIMNW